MLSKKLLVVLLLVSLLLLVEIDCKRRKRKWKVKKVEPEVRPEELEDWDKKPKTAPRNFKEWSKLTDKDFERLEEDPPEKPKRRPAEAVLNRPKLDPADPEPFHRARLKNKVSVCRVKLKSPDGGPYTKEGQALNDLILRWALQLKAAGVDFRPTYEGNNLLSLTLLDGSKGFDVKNYVLQQSEIEYFEWEEKRYPPFQGRAEL